MKIEDLVRDNVKRMKPYSSARDEFNMAGKVQLDANENPFGNGLNRYPDPYQVEAKEVLASIKGLDPANLILGNGSDELIDLLIRIFCVPAKDNVIALSPSYGMYKVSCALNDVTLKEVSLNEDFSFNASDLLREVDENTKMIFLCSPNNPTGNTLDIAEIECLLREFKGIVIIDEAYVDFTDEISWSYRLNEYPQLVVLQTLSKAFGYAGARLGLCWSSGEIVALLNRVKPPYNINALTQNVVTKIQDELPNIRAVIQELIQQRESLKEELNQLGIVEKVYPSQANFLLVKFANSASVYADLLEAGIVVRDRSNQAGCANCLRISIGTPDEMNLLKEKLKNIESEKSIVYR